MPISDIEALDIFIRCAAVGQLMLICGVYVRKPLTGQRLTLLAIAACTGGYLLLTAPIPDVRYGIFRNVLLVLTDALPYSFWFAAMYFFKDDFSPRRWPVWIKGAIGSWMAWHVYFFGYLGGNGAFHDVSHGVAIALMLHVIHVALSGRGDDLIDSRRITRILVAVLASLYGIYLALAQLFSRHFQHELFDVLNAAVIFLATAGLAGLLLQPRARVLAQVAETGPQAAASAHDGIPPQVRLLKQKLDDFMDNGGYRQTGLGISELADQLSCPEHHLRRLINHNLGFRNFSAFLNSHRIRDARDQLANRDLDNTPVLTIALSLGYGSIGPFNRAFKAETGQTPSEYRRSIRNRP